MQAIATLVQSDPYLRLPFIDRIASRRERRARLWPPIVTATPTKTAVVWVVPAKPLVYRMWFDDLIAEATRVLAMPPKRPVDVGQIQKAVAEHYGLSWEIMFSGVRRANVVRPRHLAMYLSRTMTLRSLQDIGRRFGGRDHSTIINAIQKMTRLLASDSAFAADVEAIMVTLQSSRPV